MEHPLLNLAFWRKVMRISSMQIVLLLVFTGMSAAADLEAQVLEKPISLHVEAQEISKALRKIEKQAAIKFVFSPQVIKAGQKVNVHSEQETLGNLLDKMFRPLGIRYEVSGKYILLSDSRPHPIYAREEASHADFTQPPPDRTVTGKVTDENGDGLPGVSIVLKGTQRGTISDAAGTYELVLPDGDNTLIFSFVGFLSQELQVGSRTAVDVVLSIDEKSLEEVVVVGYGVQKKADITGSVAQVASKELTAIPTFGPTMALKGRATGVEIRQNSGNPSSRVEVRIRGANSMIGSNDPLYVVDGVPLIGGADFLSSFEVETMDILKDASATAIYGARGANGVIIITTRKGLKGQKGKISIDSYYGFQKEVNRYRVLNAGQYAVIANEWLKNEGQNPYFDVNQIHDLDTDWQNEIFRTAPVQNHTLSFSGSSEKSSYFLSGNFFSKEGIIENTSAKNGALNLRLQQELNKRISISENITLSRREGFNTPIDNGAYGKTMLSGALSAPPTLSVYDASGLPTRIESAYFFGSTDMQNPVLFLSPRKDRALTNKILANTTLDLRLLDGLAFRSLAGLEYSFRTNDNFTPVIYPADRGFASDGYGYESSFVSENTLTYARIFNEHHSINLVGGGTYQTFSSRNQTASVTGLTTNITENLNLNGANTFNAPVNGLSQWVLLSGLGRVNYAYKSKYLVTASIRVDGSSRFGANNKWGIFPSGALGWRVSDEPFMQGISQISDLKLRASYGVTGNTALSPYQSLSRLSTVRYIAEGDNLLVGWAPSGVSNAGLKWEETRQLDLGFDLSLWGNRMNMTFDYYRKKTSSLLATVPTPSSSGFTSTLDNLGEIQNQGLEFALNATILRGPLKWDVTTNFSANRNKVLMLSKGSDIESGTLDLPFSAATNIIREDHPFGMFYGYKEAGLDDNGLIKYADINQDGIVNANDRTIIGNPYPTFVSSLNTTLIFREFSLNLFVDGSQGNDIFWATAGTHLNSFQRGQNQFVDIVDNYWTAENPNPNAKYPKISSASSFTVSDRFVKDGSYLRLKSITLSYDIPMSELKTQWLNKARIYISSANLFTFTKYPGLDPEVNTVAVDDQNAASRARIGIDQGGYPSAKTFLLGLSLSF